jgi:thymidylate synthase (FAD)
MSKIEVTFVDSMGSDLSVANAARVSFGKKSEWDVDYDTPAFTGKNVLSERDTKLIKYLAKHKHISPFGHAFASFHVKAPIFVARQLVKHKFLRWNEISRRYVDDEPEFYVPDVWRAKADDVKQGSSSDAVGMYESLWGFANADEDYCAHMKEAEYLYGHMVKSGIAPEQARMVLPQSTMTEWYWSGSLDAFADMCRLRCKPDTQYESRLVADQVSTIMQDLYPVSWAALMGNS